MQKKIYLLLIPVTGMVSTELLLLYSLGVFNLANVGELYLKILGFISSIGWKMQPNMFLTSNLSLMLLIPLFVLLKYAKTPVNPYKKESVYLVAAHIIVYSILIRVGSIILGEHPYLVLVPAIYFVTIAVKFYEQYSLADFGFHIKHLPQAVGIGLGVTCVLEIGYLPYVLIRGSAVLETSISRVFIMFLLTLSWVLPYHMLGELFLRGYVQTKVEKITNYRTALVFQALFSALIYGFLQSRFDVVFLGYVTFFSMLMGYLYYRTKTLVPCIIVQTLMSGIMSPINEQLSKGLTLYDRTVTFLLWIGTVVFMVIVYEYFRRRNQLEAQ